MHTLTTEDKNDLIKWVYLNITSKLTQSILVLAIKLCNNWEQADALFNKLDNKYIFNRD